jgi:hypothetical protein
MNGDDRDSDPKRGAGENESRPPTSRQPSSAQVFVADGAGGMRSVEDLRFDHQVFPRFMAATCPTRSRAPSFALRPSGGTRRSPSPLIARTFSIPR